MNAKLNRRMGKAGRTLLPALALLLSGSGLTAQTDIGGESDHDVDATTPRASLADCRVVRAWADGDLSQGFRLRARVDCDRPVEWLFVGMRGPGIASELPRTWADERSAEVYVGGKEARIPASGLAEVETRPFRPHDGVVDGRGEGDLLDYAITLVDRSGAGTEVRVSVPVRAWAQTPAPALAELEAPGAGGRVMASLDRGPVGGR